MRTPPTEKLKETFLTTLIELLQTTLVVTDFLEKSLKEVINRVLAMDSAQTSTSISMASLQRALTKDEDIQF